MRIRIDKASDFNWYHNLIGKEIDVVRITQRGVAVVKHKKSDLRVRQGDFVIVGGRKSRGQLCTKEMRDKIILMFHRGSSMMNVYRETSLTFGKIREIWEDWKLNHNYLLGHKSTPYYQTEQEMIVGFQCSYYDLSESEKAMYNFKN